MTSGACHRGGTPSSHSEARASTFTTATLAWARLRRSSGCRSKIRCARSAAPCRRDRAVGSLVEAERVEIFKCRVSRIAESPPGSRFDSPRVLLVLRSCDSIRGRASDESPVEQSDSSRTMALTAAHTNARDRSSVSRELALRPECSAQARTPPTARPAPRGERRGLLVLTAGPVLCFYGVTPPAR
jgi:hypothetical protein